VHRYVEAKLKEAGMATGKDVERGEDLALNELTAGGGIRKHRIAHTASHTHNTHTHTHTHAYTHAHTHAHKHVARTHPHSLSHS
jgi:hypothetical protein